jgi:hypothetical protein
LMSLAPAALSTWPTPPSLMKASRSSAVTHIGPHDIACQPTMRLRSCRVRWCIAYS